MPAGPPVAAGGLGPRPKKRNPILTLLLPIAFSVGGQILGAILGAIEPMLALVGSLVALVGAVLAFYWIIVMLLEVKRVTQDDGFMWWLVFVPCVNYYLLWWALPQQVTKAKQMAGLPNPARSIILYIILILYALPADLNELAEESAGGAAGPGPAPGGMPPGGAPGGFGGPPGGAPPGAPGMGGPPMGGMPPGGAPGGYGGPPGGAPPPGGFGGPPAG